MTSQPRQSRSLTRASLVHYLPTHVMVVIGVAAAVAVLAGALLVGASVRDSLRELALGRLGATDAVIVSPTFFRTALSDDLSATAAASPIRSAAPLVVAAGAVVHDDSKRGAGRVMVYGIDERFTRFHGIGGFEVGGRDALINRALADELGAGSGDSLTIRVARPSDIPLSTLQGRRELTGERLRVTVARVLDREPMSEFSLAPSQGPVLAVFVPLIRLQRDLELGDHANTIVVSVGGDLAPSDAIERLRAQLARVVALDDLGLRVRPQLAQGPIVIEARGGFIPPSAVDAIEKQASADGRTVVPVLTYVANAIRIGDREVPYSTVSGISAGSAGSSGSAGSASSAGSAGSAGSPGSRPPIWLNEWTASDLAARVGDEVTLDYFLWSDEAGLITKSTTFTLEGILPMSGIGVDPTLTPDYPGITDTADITSWDPPFPVDLKKVRPKDEDYWDAHRAAPKAVVTLADGQRLWGARFGNVSSLRISGDAPFTPNVDPLAAGLSIRAVRAEALAASTGTTDFGQYFLYFSFFLVVSALLLAYLFFALGLEQRMREVGLLAALGFTPEKIRGSFVREGAVLAGVGALVGAVAAVGYGALILYGLRTWWIGAVGTTALRLHIAPEWLAMGAAGAFAAGLLALWLGVRAMSRRSPRSLLTGVEPTERERSTVQPRKARRAQWIAVVFAAVGLLLLVAANSGSIDPTAGFFGAGGAWLVAGLNMAALLLRRSRASALHARQRFAVVRLGIRHTAAAPKRSVLSLALIALACFVLVTVGAFRREAGTLDVDRRSGTGGYALMAESVAPLMHDPDTPSGRAELGLDRDDPVLSSVSVTRVRLRPGDEASCLTLYKPTNPRIIAPEASFIEESRFSFSQSLATTAEEQTNPWRLLNRTFEDGAIPAVADQTTLTYALHLKVGDDFVLTPDGQSPVRLRIVGALADSLLQSELIIGEAAFVRLFPRNEGYRVWLIDLASGDAPAARGDTPSAVARSASADRRSLGEGWSGLSIAAPSAGNAQAITAYLEDQFSDFGLDVMDTHARLASYHQVENTYLATFQALGGLGLLLGTVGLGAVLARNVLERRRELALLGAVGFQPKDVRLMVLSESLTLIVGGLLLGSASAMVAILPALRERAQALPWAELGAMLVGVIVTGLLASLLAVRMATSTRVVEALKTE